MALTASNNHKFASGELVTATKLNNVKVIQTDNTANNDAFTGSAGQLTYDTTTSELRVHDGASAGGAVIGGSGGVDTSAITDNAITTAKITDGNVTTAKIATDAITADKIGDDAVTLDHLNDDVVSPTGGLELGPNGLQLAVSEESLQITLVLNNATGVTYVKGSTHDTTTAGQVDTRFLNVADSYRWINDNVASTRVAVSLVFETDTTDTYDHYLALTNASQLGDVTWVSSQVGGAFSGTPIPSTASLPKVTMIASNVFSPAPIPLWFNSPTKIQGLHLDFVSKPTGAGQIFSLIRALGAIVSIECCKLTVTQPSGGNNIRTVFEAINSGIIRITNPFQTATSGAGLTNPFNKTGANNEVRALDIDITDCTVDSVFSADSASTLELNEFRAVGRTDLSGIHLVGGTGKTVNITGSFMNLQLASQLSSNTIFSRANGMTINCPEVFFAFGFCPLRVGQYISPSATRFPIFPGTIAFDASNTSGEDYAISTDFHASDQAIGPVANTGMEIRTNYYT